ncbi:MAG TPA: AAA family ATPase, partial [Rhodoglobus sp.]|nr:AAA family ATPase [Rhodoglobus sp.]
MGDSQGQSVRFAPRVASWQLTRPGLVERIERGVSDGLVVLRAGAGAGKTSLLAEWARTTARRGTWITVDDDITGRFALWDRVLVALGTSGSQTAAESVLARGESRLRAALQSAFADAPHVLVLDDLHRVDDGAVADDIAWLVRSTPCAVVVATRARTPLESPGVATRLGTTVLAPDVLTFTRAETADLVGADAADDAFEHLGGWPLATRALSLELRRERDVSSALNAVAAMLTEVSPALPSAAADPAVLDFAVRTSIADWLTVELAARIVPDADAAAMLAMLEGEGMGSWSGDAGVPVFRYQPFVRIALSRMTETLPATELRSARRAHAIWADAEGLVVVAAREAVAIADWDLLAELTQRHFRRIMRLHRPEWTAFMGAVPLDRLRAHPVLTAVYLQILNGDSAATDRLRALSGLLMSSVAPLRDRGSRLDRIWRNSSLLAAERITGRYAAATATAERLSALLATLEPEEYEAIEDYLPILHVHLGTTFLYAGDVPMAIAALQEALRVDVESPWTHLHARALLALIAALEGDMLTAERRLHEVDTVTALQGWQGTYYAAGYHLGRALAAIERFDADAARSQLERLEEHYDTIEHWPLI